ncbi:MAG TPA: MFS transporter [Solirubrobacter sp.]|nr:MFS transporter [Solirubrobacter sp.]
MSSSTGSRPAVRAQPPVETPPRGLARIAAARRALPENVRILALVSLANDSASELAYPVVPLFLAVTLGAPIALIGLIEGIAEAMALGFRLISGWLSDRAATEPRRRPWIMAGYGLSTFARAGVAAAPAWGYVLGAKIADRIGKGTRGAPRDALIRDSTPKELVGSAFGYHRSADTIGAIVGPLVAAVMLAAGCSLRTILWVAVVPGVVTLVLIGRIREARPSGVSAKKKHAPELAGARALPGSFWSVMLIWVVFSLGNSSDAFLLLRAHDLGLATLLTVLAYAGYNLVFAGLSWPLGALSDRLSRAAIFALGMVVFTLVYVGFALAPGTWAVWPLFAFYGVYVAATEGVGRAWIADHVSEGHVGTAYGVFYAATAAAALVASIAAGVLWTYVSPSAPFWLGAATAAAAAVLLGVRALSRELSPRLAQATLASLLVATVAVAAVEHHRLGDLFRHRGEAEVPVVSTRPCSDIGAARVTPDLPAGFPVLPGVAYTDNDATWSTHGYLERSIRATHDDYVRALEGAGYRVTRSEVDPWDAELAFAGRGRTGDVEIFQECRSRTWIHVQVR